MKLGPDGRVKAGEGEKKVMRFWGSVHTLDILSSCSVRFSQSVQPSTAWEENTPYPLAAAPPTYPPPAPVSCRWISIRLVLPRVSKSQLQSHRRLGWGPHIVPLCVFLLLTIDWANWTPLPEWLNGVSQWRAWGRGRGWDRRKWEKVGGGVKILFQSNEWS